MPRPEIDLPGYLRLLWRRKWTILLVTFVVTGSAVLASSRQTPVYEARADLLMPPVIVQSNDPGAGIPTELQVLTSRPVQDAVKAHHGSAPPVSVAQLGSSNVVRIRARSHSARDGALIANAYANAYIDYRRAGASRTLLDVSAKVQAEMSDLQVQIDSLDAKLKNAPPIGLSPAEQAAARQRDALLVEQQGDRQRLDQLQLDAAVQGGGAQLISPATPGVAVEPRPVRTGVLAGAVGLMLGLGWALLAERFDDSVSSKDEMEEIVAGVPVVGLIPAYGSRKSHRDQSLVTVYAPTSPAAEAYRSLRTGLQIMDRPRHTVQLTSPVGGDGKTSTAANLAVTLARAGKRVIVVGCDLRRPMVHQFFGVGNDVGLTSVLLDEVSLDEALQAVSAHDRISVLSSGPGRADPSELLSSQEFLELLETLKRRADIVLVDSAPVLPVTDAVVLSARVDAVLLVTRMRSTTRKQLRQATETLWQAGAPLAGTILNATVGEETYVSSYGYHDAASPGPGRGAGRGGRDDPVRFTPAPLRRRSAARAKPAAPVERAAGSSMRGRFEFGSDEPAATPPSPSNPRNGSAVGVPATTPEVEPKRQRRRPRW